MSTLVVDAESLVARKVSVSADSLVVDLADGRTRVRDTLGGPFDVGRPVGPVAVPATIVGQPECP